MIEKAHYILVFVTSWVVIASAGAAVVGRSAPPPQEDDTRTGRAEYVEMGWHQCHGYEGQGARSTGPRIAPEPLPFEMFSTWVRRPPEVMPAYSPKVLSEDKLRRIHEYLLSIPLPPDVSRLPALSEN